MTLRGIEPSSPADQRAPLRKKKQRLLRLFVQNCGLAKTRQIKAQSSHDEVATEASLADIGWGSLFVAIIRLQSSGPYLRNYLPLTTKMTSSM